MLRRRSLDALHGSNVNNRYHSPQHILSNGASFNAFIKSNIFSSNNQTVQSDSRRIHHKEDNNNHHSATSTGMNPSIASYQQGATRPSQYSNRLSPSSAVGSTIREIPLNNEQQKYSPNFEQVYSTSSPSSKRSMIINTSHNNKNVASHLRSDYGIHDGHRHDRHNILHRNHPYFREESLHSNAARLTTDTTTSNDNELEYYKTAEVQKGTRDAFLENSNNNVDDDDDSLTRLTMAMEWNNQSFDSDN
jgi:hypothetical protein